MTKESQKRALRLKQLRARKDISQYALADNSGINRDTIAKLESRNAPNHPDPETIATLAKHVGSTYIFLMHGIVDADSFDVDIRSIAIRLQSMSEERKENMTTIFNTILNKY